MRDTFLFREKGDASVSKRRTSSFPTLFANFPAAFCRLAVSYRARYRVNRKSRTKGRKSRELRRGCEARPRRLAHERSAARLLHIYAHASVACDFSSNLFAPFPFSKKDQQKRKRRVSSGTLPIWHLSIPEGRIFIWLSIEKLYVRRNVERGSKLDSYFPPFFPY